MAKAKKDALKSLGRKFYRINHDLERLDMRCLPGAEILSVEELEAVRTGAMAACAVVESATGQLGADEAEITGAARTISLAAAILAAAISTHIHYTVDEDSHDIDDHAPAAKVHITIEREG